MAQFSHRVIVEGFTYEVTGTVEVDEGADSIVIDQIKEYRDPYGIGLGVVRSDISDGLKDVVLDQFNREVQELFAQR